MGKLEAQFEDDIDNTYIVAKRDLKYRATLLKQMIDEYGGVGAAKRLMAKDDTSDGFRKLWELGRLDLTVEALVSKSEYATLFTEEEKAKARKRLEDVQYQFPR